MPSASTPLAMILDALVDLRREMSKQLEGSFAGETTMLATETLVLAELHVFATRTPSDLARATGLSRGRVSHLLDSLEGADLIHRHQDEDDRRRWIVSLTTDGRLAADAASHRVANVHQMSSGILGPAGLEMLHQQLRQLQRAGREARERGVHGPQVSVADRDLPSRPKPSEPSF